MQAYFGHASAHLGFHLTVEDWGEEIFAEGVGVKCKNERVGRGRGRKVISSILPPTGHYTNPLPVKHLITIKDGGIVSLIYLAFRSKITPALQDRCLSQLCLTKL